MLHQFYYLLAGRAKQGTDLGQTHSVEGADENHEGRLAALRDGK
nr:hypothetical protein [Hymenobacter nivis]